MGEAENNLDRSIYRRLEEVIGCKWSVSVLTSIRAGVARPGALERRIPGRARAGRGISAKVLGERLRKLTQYGLLSRTTFPEVPPRTEYALTRTLADARAGRTGIGAYYRADSPAGRAP
jgi:DNA-binding HxlR family transcriptional regulator